MKRFFLGLLALSTMVATTANAGLIPRKSFQEVFFLANGGAATGPCKSAASACSFVDRDLMAIPANTVIERVYAIVDTAITGTTNFDVGDDDDADGFIDGSLSMTLGTLGLYGWDAKLAGAYLRSQTAGATDPADIYVVPASKWYGAAGKEVKLDVTGTNTAGRARVVVEGFFAGDKHY